MLKEYDLVELRRNVPSTNLPVGTIGTIVMICPGNPPGYEVEFTGANGLTLLGLVTLCEEDIALISEQEYSRLKAVMEKNR